MANHVEIKILAQIPEHDRHAGHKAIVNTEDPVAAVVAALEAAGLTNIEATREIVKKRPKVGLATASPAATAETNTTTGV